MSDAPPSYTAATGNKATPGVQVTDPQGETHRANSTSVVSGQRPGHARASSDAGSMLSDVSDGDLHLPGTDESRRSMDDERRELPEGWVRCFDPKNEHHFYVDTATKRSTWVHPYDDPEFLRTLPDTHPANPNSAEAQAMRKRADDEALLAKRMQAKKDADRSGASTTKDGKLGSPTSPTSSSGEGSRNWFQRKKDQLVGTKEERAKAKAEKRRIRAEQERKAEEQYQAYQKRRKELLQKQLNDPNIRRYYASDPFGYAAPTSPFSRGGGLYSSPYGYGYPGGYGARYGYGGGYGGYGMGGMGGMGMGLPLAGGLAGGLLLGSALDGGFGGGYGGYGGGFDGGGMGGGGFDGGGMGGGDMGGGGGGGF